MKRIIFFQLGDRERISVRQFLYSIRNLVGILEDLDASISKNKFGSVRWEVAVLSKKSPALIGVEGIRRSSKLPDSTPIVEREMLRGLNNLSKSPERGEYYSDSALEKIRNVAAQAKSIGPLKVYTNGGTKKETFINESTFDNIEELIGVKYKGFGSVVGSLDAITVHNRNEFRIWDENTGKSVTCLFGSDMLKKVKDLLREKVLVYGEVYSNQRGEPVSIVVDGMECKTPQNELPTIKEMSGLVKDMYEGKTLKEYLEDIKND
jgi:hypothetical protein